MKLIFECGTEGQQLSLMPACDVPEVSFRETRGQPLELPSVCENELTRHYRALSNMRSLYTKGVSAILWETIRFAYEMGIDEEVLKIIAETEGPQFEKLAHSRLISSFLHSKRRYEEMGELKKLLSDNKMLNDIIMVSAAENRFKDICMKNKKIQKENDEYGCYDSYKDIFYALKNIK